MVRSNSGQKDRRTVLDLVVTVISHDYGYTQVQGIGELRKIWAHKHPDMAFESGTDNHPPRTHCNDSVAYTDKLEAECS